MSDDQTVIIAGQPRTQIYVNTQDQLVIEQEGPDDNTYVVFNVGCLAILLRAIQTVIDADAKAAGGGS